MDAIEGLMQRLRILEREIERLKTIEAGGGGGGAGSDTTAIHDNVAGEIAVIAAKATPISGDYLVIEDSADSNNKKSVTIGDLPTGADANAIHTNVSAEISGLTSKATPVSADLLVIEDSAASDAKKKIQVGSLPYIPGTSTDLIHLGQILALARGQALS